MKNKKPVPAKKSLIRLGIAFYGKKFFSKKVKLVHDGTLKKMEPPYIVVANHSNFIDVGGLIMMMYPNCASFVISETQKANWPKLIDKMGVLPKKQFTVDMSLLSNIRYILSKKRPVVIYPEAKLSVVGVPNIIKPSAAKLVKMFKVPLVTVCFHGAYLHHPRWAKGNRFVTVTADVKLAVDAEEAKTITADEIHNRIVENLSYDDYAYQLENRIEIDVPNLVEGLEHILYKCPSCSGEFVMTGHGNQLSCAKCGHKVTQNKYGQLEGGKFDKVADWYFWQRDCVRKELQDGSYAYCKTFIAQKLVKNKYVDLGTAEITHDERGITATIVDGETLFYPAGMFYTLSFNNDYVYLPTSEAVYRFKRIAEIGSTTKLNLAIEQQTQLLENK
ncbi:MAG: 1-acyl-sn-glycerol-3-phosphate acyltransferase [Corallococcus sp.]|nr:1-acyl-sn-glycerol-3-phosphate acyltransferase [Corallococcus sp.]MCM1359315.1 1-acyl-sn-glycerol-3-phosphate acyltransferase [Corallococcus sp.]MCM1394874.1 1-acyl-sn-glycerol-3-phosphate acyltransferase [Corallococcus sp.]